MTEPFERLSTGIDGLDEILDGGFIRGRSYMLRGGPGAGKTVLGFHFLAAGVADGETALFVNLEEDVDDLRANAAQFGFDVDAIEYLDLSPSADVFAEDQSYDLFTPADVEGGPLTDRIVERVEAVDPDRVVVDPVTQFRYLTDGEYQFRKQVIGFMRFLKRRDATVLFTTQETETVSTDDLQFISDGTVFLQFDDAERRLTVPKFRGSATLGGDHAFRITDAGLVVYPQLRPGRGHGVAADADRSEAVPSGVPEVDELLHGGLTRGTVGIITGPTGVGKTTLGAQFMKEAAGRGERSVIYLFEESKRTFVQRCRAINIPVAEMIERGTLAVEEVEALDHSPQEFAHRVRKDVEENDTSIVMVDGISGYELTFRDDEAETARQIHALGRYLKNAGVTTLLIDEMPNVTGEFVATRGNISYLADAIVFLRHIEVDGRLEKSIGVLKKRTTDFERTLRRFEITAHGIKVGEPLTGLRNILSGSPEVVERHERSADDRD